MKKYLMTGIAALAIGGMFTSCSHDMSLYNGDGTKAVVDKYEQAFVDAYGEPDENQTWGFGEKTTTVAGTRGMTRTIQPSYEFPDDADASKFLAEVPDGVTRDGNHDFGTNFIDEEWTGNVNIWGGGGTAENNWQASGGTLYVKGNCDFSNKSFYFAGNSELYLLEGATLTLGENNGSGNLQQNTNIYIAESAKLIAKGELKLNNGLHIFNHGTIETDKLSTNSNSWLVNGATGTVTVANKISVENELSVIENNGTITAADLNTAGSGKFENNGDVTITGTTFINSNNNTWVNNGQYHTGNFLYNAASDEVINNCRLTVDEDFNMNLGDNPGDGNFKMDAGAGVVTKNFNGGGNWAKNYSTGWSEGKGGPFYIYMGENSVFKVTETATMNATKADYGIYGPENGGYAVFQAKNIVNGKDNQGFEVTYGNNLYVSAESHFAQGNDGQADHPFIDLKGNAKIYAPGFEDGLPAVTITETTCNPGFIGAGGGETVETVTDKIRVIAEDLTIGDNKNFKEGSDFDFNDVVFDVFWTHIPNNDDKSTQSIKLIIYAAGGELPIFIGYKDDPNWEIHKLLGDVNDDPNITHKTMMNTYKGEHHAYHYREIDLPRDYPWSGSEIGPVANSIKIYVQKSGTKHELTAEKGRVACKIAVGVNYEWCDELEDINVKYNGNFEKYVKGQIADYEWY